MLNDAAIHSIVTMVIQHFSINIVKKIKDDISNCAPVTWK